MPYRIQEIQDRYYLEKQLTMNCSANLVVLCVTDVLPKKQLFDCKLVFGSLCLKTV